MQSPQASFGDHELRNGLIYSDTMGLPRPVTGAFASVYRVRCSNRDTALRCFLHNTSDQENRYQQISDYVQNDDLVYTVTFDYLQQGVQVAGSWFPALKMEWVDGLPLDVFITQNLHNSSVLEQLGEKFKQMMFDLENAGIAHGDLQHGNIIVLPDLELRLVDYDGMFVPSMQGLHSNELGHANYQHPQRQAHHFGSYLDNFAAWVIYASITAARIDPRLWHQLGAGDDCMLFRRADFHAPLKSRAFSMFENHSHPHLRELGRFLRGQLNCSPDAIPHLQTTVPSVGNLPELSPETLAAAPASQPKARSVADLPEWITPSTHDFKVYRLEPELQQPVPRTVKHAPKRKNSWTAEDLQQCMLVNPLVWIMLSQLWSGFTVYADLTTHEVAMPGVVTGRSSYTNSKGQTTVTISYRYGLDKRAPQFTDSDSYSPAAADGLVEDKPVTIRALPSNPRIHEPLQSTPGTKQSSSLWSAFGLALLNLCLELFIWVPALFHRKLARSGTAALAEVVELRKVIGTNNRASYNATIEFAPNASKSSGSEREQRLIRKVLTLKEHEFEQLEKDAIVSVLFEPQDPYSVRIYKFLRYQPIVSDASSTNAAEAKLRENS